MDNIETLEQAKLAGKQLGGKLLKQEKEINLDFSNLMNDITSVDENDSEMQTLAALLSLPNDKFNLLAPAFYEELEKAYNSSNNQLLLSRSLNLSGKTVEEIREDYENLCNLIDEQLIGYPVKKVDFLKQLIGLFYNAISEADGIEKQILEVPIELCHPDAKLPTYAHLTDSGMDVYAVEDITINPGQTVLVPTGIKVAIPKGYELQVRPKSGRSLKSKLRVANAPGTIDAGYRDEVGIIIDNIAPVIKSADMDENGRLYNVLWGESYTIEKGEKIAQLVLAKVPKVAWMQVDSVMDSNDRGGGFGSTSLYSPDDSRYGSDLK